tara:strand:- start:442 stop:771 length:330 start_codon:yes stop_codon:yes gene_type:complete
MYVYIFFLLLIIIENIADFIFYQSIIHKNLKKYKYYIITFGCFLYVIIGLLYYNILDIYRNFAIPNAIYQGLTIILATFISVVILKENLTRNKYIGITLILIGLIALHF